MTSDQFQQILNHPRRFLDNKYVYLVVSRRAGGLSVGINMNPGQECNFDCVYCEVEREHPPIRKPVDSVMVGKELQQVLALLRLNQIRSLPEFKTAPESILQLKQVTLSGDGEPTLCPNFDEVMREVCRVRQDLQVGGFQIVVITNGTGLHLPATRAGLALLSAQDEIWVKLDAGTDRFKEVINRTKIPIDLVLTNIAETSHYHPVVIQSLFCRFEADEPDDDEIKAYVRRLTELKEHGVRIQRVQIYSIARKPAEIDCQPLPLSRLSEIARLVRKRTGFPAEVF